MKQFLNNEDKNGTSIQESTEVLDLHRTSLTDGVPRTHIPTFYHMFGVMPQCCKPSLTEFITSSLLDALTHEWFPSDTRDDVVRISDCVGCTVPWTEVDP